jgi:adenosine deaminase
VLTPELETFIARMPKVELHLHLEGSIKPLTLLELAKRNHVNLPVQTVAGVEQLFHYDNFLEFLAVYMGFARAIVRGEDFERLAYELGMSLAAQQTLYAEVMISPMQYLLRGIDLHEVVAGAAAGFAQVEKETGLVIRLAFDYGRQYGPDQAWQVLEIAQKLMPYGLVAWSIGGDEIGYPPEPYAEVFAAARAAGLSLMAHAGEAVGPASVWGAVDVLQAKRVGHGIRSVDDPALLEHLCKLGITLDVCPSSNLCTGVVNSWAQHPLRQLYMHGVQVTINTDDPTFFQTTLTEEYRRVVNHFGFGVDDLCHLVCNGVRAAFLSPADKISLLQRVEKKLGNLRSELELPYSGLTSPKC